MVLHWGTLHAPYIPIISIQRLLSPTLVALEATLSEADGANLLSFLDNYSLICRNLKTVEFHFSAKPHAETTIQALSQAICRQQILENVVLRVPINGTALKHLSTLPTLKALTVTLSERSALYKRTFLPTDPLFCSAEELHLTVWDLDLVTSLLRPHDQIFHVFRLYHRGRQTSEALLTFLNVLTSRSRTIPLRDLSLSFVDFSHPISANQMAREAMRYRLSYETLRPLMVFGSLRELMIEWSEQISLNDDELANLARSWPLLRVFNVYCGRGGYPPFSTKYATLRGLLTLVNACRKLLVVSLPLDARHIPVVKETEICATHFQCITLPESPIDEALPVAEFLFKYLPCLTAVDARFLRPPGTNDAQIMAYEQAWVEVEMHLDERHYSLYGSGGSDSEGSDEYGGNSVLSS